MVEGVGNNGCEYMTGGKVVILGEVGLNFAAGMSGGIAYVYDEQKTLEARCNRDLVDIEAPSEDELVFIQNLIREHVDRTGSPLGIKMLHRFDRLSKNFMRVIPRDYKRIQTLIANEEAAGYSHDEATERAFEMIRGN